MKLKLTIAAILIALMIIIVPANGAIFKWLGIEANAYGMCIDDFSLTDNIAMLSSSLVDVEPMTGMDDMDCPVHPRINVMSSLNGEVK